MDYVQNLLSPDRFPRLATLFVASKPIGGSLTTELQLLVTMRDQGVISADHFNLMIERLGA